VQTGAQAQGRIDLGLRNTVRSNPEVEIPVTLLKYGPIPAAKKPESTGIDRGVKSKAQRALSEAAGSTRSLIPA
jgi:hypothetical protein